MKDETESYNWVFSIDKLYCVFLVFILNPPKRSLDTKTISEFIEGKATKLLYAALCLFVFHSLLSLNNTQTKWNSISEFLYCLLKIFFMDLFPTNVEK